MIGPEALSCFESKRANPVDQARSLVQEVGHPNPQVLPDAFPVNTEEKNVPARVRKIGKALLCHCQGNERDRRTSGTGTLDGAGIREARRDMDYEGAITIKSFGAISDEITQATGSSDEPARAALTFYQSLFSS